MAFKSGLVALIGKPNVGKSTLLNAFVGHKVSIVSNKPQTTRRRVLGICQTADYQVAFIDTPGIHEPHTRLARGMVQQARTALVDIDLALVVVDPTRKPDDLDEQIAELLRASQVPVLVVLNKMDLLKAEFVTARVEEYSTLFAGDYMLTTATRGENLDKLLELILSKLPDGEALFPEDEFTDQSTRFLVAELIREKVLVSTRQEIPHATAVGIEEWEEMENGILRIAAVVVVERSGQRAILIGKGGKFVKEIGSKARVEIEALLGRQVFLELHVKVREDWRQNLRIIRELEYSD